MIFLDTDLLAGRNLTEAGAAAFCIQRPVVVLASVSNQSEMARTSKLFER